MKWAHDFVDIIPGDKSNKVMREEFGAGTEVFQFLVGWGRAELDLGKSGCWPMVILVSQWSPAWPCL